MTTIEEYAKQSVPQRLERLARTADELAATIRGQSEATLARRPDATNWAAKEVICHLRDTEELFAGRFELILSMADPKLPGFGPPDRWAEERQYLRNDAGEALAAFRLRRQDTLGFLRKLASSDLQRAGLHASRGRMTVDDFITLMAWHDDNHLEQLGRALQGKV